MEIGQVCYKIAGRDSGWCVVLEKIDRSFVKIDGQTRRKRCNIAHLELIDKKLKIAKTATRDEILKLLEKEGLLKIKKSKQYKK